MKTIRNTKFIYLDACATSPPRVEVINKVSEIQSTCWGNSSSSHFYGIAAAEVVEGQFPENSTKSHHWNLMGQKL